MIMLIIIIIIIIISLLASNLSVELRMKQIRLNVRSIALYGSDT